MIPAGILTRRRAPVGGNYIAGFSPWNITQYYGGAIPNDGEGHYYYSGWNALGGTTPNLAMNIGDEFGVRVVSKELSSAGLYLFSKADADPLWENAVFAVWAVDVVVSGQGVVIMTNEAGAETSQNVPVGSFVTIKRATSTTVEVYNYANPSSGGTLIGSLAISSQYRFPYIVFWEEGNSAMYPQIKMT